MDAEQWFPSDTGDDDGRGDDGLYSHHLRSPPVRVPVHHQEYSSPEPSQSKRRFGASHRQSQHPPRDSYRPAQGYDNRSGNSVGFQRVVSHVGGRNNHRRMSSYSMQDEPDFQFGDDRDQRYQRDERDMHHHQQHQYQQQHNHYMHPNHAQHQQQQQQQQYDDHQQQSYQQFPPHQQQRQQQGAHASQPKYNSVNARSSGNSLIKPGASIMSNNEETALLTQRLNPPKKQDSFIGHIMSAKKKAGISPRITHKRPMALEQASAPPTHRSPHELVSSASEVESPERANPAWKSTRSGTLQKKPRILLTPSKAPPPAPSAASRVPVRSSTRQSLSRNTSLESASSSAGHPMLKNNRRRSLNSFQAASYDVEPLKLRARAPSKRLEKKKASKFGTADQPIDLDSDSDQGTGQKSKTQEAPDTGPGFDVESMKNDCIAQIDKCDAWIGQFPCSADLIFMADCMWIYNISAKLRARPFKTKTFKLQYRTVQEIHIYRWNPEYSEKPDETQDVAEKLISEASFMALKAPFTSPEQRIDVKSVYDPHGDDQSKQFLVIRSLQDDREGGTFGQIEDSLRAKCKASVNLISDRRDGKIYLQGLLVKSDPAPESRTRMRTRSTEDLRSGEESEEENGERCMVQLTYPLPPCSTDLVAITRGDISRLKPRHYLNDNIIDYFFKRLIREDFRSSPFIQKNVLFMSSHFYSRLRMGTGTKLNERLKSGYSNVATWFTNTNIFDRSLIFIPINKDMHWSIAVIVNPRLAAKETNSEVILTDKSVCAKMETQQILIGCQDEPVSCIAILDPLGSYHSKPAISRHLKAFLKFEWSRPSKTEADAASLTYNLDSVQLVDVPIPHQENSFDCGVYILKFAEVMIRNYEALASAYDDVKDDGIIPKHVIDEKLEALISSRAFTADDVARQRKQIEETIASDTTKYQLALLEQKRDPQLNAEGHSKSDGKEADTVDHEEQKGTETESDENMKDAVEDTKEGSAAGDTIEDETQQTLESKLDYSKVHETLGRMEEQEADTEDDEAGDEKEVSEAETEVVNLDDDDDDEEDVLFTLEVVDPGSPQPDDGEADRQADDGDVEC